MGASNADEVGKNRDLSQYPSPSHAVNDLTAKCNTLGDGLWTHSAVSVCEVVKPSPLLELEVQYTQLRRTMAS